jgi:uncharacterized RDD family membrane protein YckC
MSSNTEEVSESPSVTQVEDGAKTLPLKPAHLFERLIAFLIDVTFIASLCMSGLTGYFFTLKKGIPLPWTMPESQQIMLGGIFLGLLFVYYLIWEGVWGTSLGKLLTQLKIVNNQGRTPSLLAALMRGLFRFIDLALFPIALLMFMEGSRYHRRLGDFVARTQVMRKIQDPTKQSNLEKASLATANRRGFAFIIDLILLGILTSGLFLVLPKQNALIMTLTPSLIGILLIFYWLLFEWWGQGTPGKMILGMKIVDEDGFPPRLAAILMRNVMRILDLNILGYFTIFFSKRKQRLGDMIAMTLVMRTRLALLRVMTFLLCLIGGLSLIYFGTFYQKGAQNAQLLFKMEHLKSFGPLHDVQDWVQTHLFRQLEINHIVLEDENHQIPPEPVFFPGNVIYVVIEASGAKIKEDHAWLQVDLILNDAANKTIWERLNIVNKKIPHAATAPLRIQTSFMVPTHSIAGAHTLVVTLRDRYTETSKEKNVSFEIKAPAAETLPVPGLPQLAQPTALPPPAPLPRPTTLPPMRQ